jgi:hypothetical protein
MSIYMFLSRRLEVPRKRKHVNWDKRRGNLNKISSKLFPPRAEGRSVDRATTVVRFEGKPEHEQTWRGNLVLVPSARVIRMYGVEWENYWFVTSDREKPGETPARIDIRSRSEQNARWSSGEKRNCRWQVACSSSGIRKFDIINIEAALCFIFFVTQKFSVKWFQ